MKKIKELLKKLWNYIEVHSKIEQQQMQQRILDQQRMNILDAMYEMAQELYTAWNESHFGNLVKINNPRIIRVDDFRSTSKGILYFFRISKESATNVIPFVALEQIKKNMNTDIASAQKQLSYYVGDYATFQYMYPFLSNGIYVMDLKDLNDGDILLSVATNYSI